VKVTFLVSVKMTFSFYSLIAVVFWRRNWILLYCTWRRIANDFWSL